MSIQPTDAASRDGTRPSFLDVKSEPSAALPPLDLLKPVAVHTGIGGWFWRFCIRFGILYTGIFWFGRVAGIVPGFGWLGAYYYRFWRSCVPWVGKHVLQLDKPVPLAFSGSGDKLFDWVQVATMLGFALTGALIWVWFDRARRGERVVAEVVRIALRYSLGLTMLSYGISKILHEQMPAPGMAVLLETYGESSPMRLLWTFMGQSWAYSAFAGGMEFLGGFLLFFRRTTLLGALILVAVMANVLMMNLSFDVPVKLYSAHYLIFAMALAAPNLRWLADVFVFHRATPAVTMTRAWPVGRPARLLLVVKALMILWILWIDSAQRVWRWADTPRPPKSEFYGMYEVESFSRDGVERPPLTTDTLRWRRVAIDEQNRVTVLYMNDARMNFRLRPGPGAGKFTLETVGSRYTQREPFTYVRAAADRLSIEGRLNGSAYSIGLHRSDDRKLLLRERGFHWISEQPFNR